MAEKILTNPYTVHTYTYTHQPSPSRLQTLHDVIVPAVGELAVVGVAPVIQSSQEDLVWIAVLEVDELPESGQETSVTVRAVLVRQDRHLVIRLRYKKTSHRHM